MWKDDPTAGEGDVGWRGKAVPVPTRGSRVTSVPIMIAVALMIAAPIAAHVTLGSPNGGETLVVGDTFVIEWVLAIQHNTENWDLWYSTTGDGGPWLPIATDLPLGNPDQGSVHTFDWTVPDDVSSQVRVRVRQDNMGIDYEDISDADLVIETGFGFADDFETGNLSAWTTVVP